MFFRLCSPRSTKFSFTLSRTCSQASSERQMPPGSAMPSIRAAILTPSPRMSSPSMMMSPTLIPIRNCIGLASATGVVLPKLSLYLDRAADRVQALANSTSAPSPMSLTIRPEWAAIVGSISSRLKAFSRDNVPVSSMPMRREYPTTSADRIAASLL